MAKHGHAYPQAQYRAADLVDAAAVRGEPAMDATAALHAVRSRAAAVLVLPEAGAGSHETRSAVLAEDLERAVSLGLGHVAATALAREVPAVDAADPEVTVRRRARTGAPVVLVRDGSAIAGAVTRRSAAADLTCGRSMAQALAELLSAEAQAFLPEIAEVARDRESRAFLVGGVVRDALLARRPGSVRDLDVVIEGDGAGVAKRLAEAHGGSVLPHPAFGTSVVEGLPPGRLDVATARRERYAAPGALPDVHFAAIGDDLARRDFTVHAMAVELGSSACSLLDPLGGERDLARRRLRILHPLSFVEDPTRILRAARYAARLGFQLDPGTRAARALAVALAPYPALSPARIAAEMERLLDDAAPGAALRELAGCAAFRLLDARWRRNAAVTRALGALEPALAWTAERGLAVRRLSLAALAIVAGQPGDVASAALRGLGYAGEPLAELLRTREASARFRRELASLAGATPSRRGVALRRRHPIELAWAWLGSGAPTRMLLDAFVSREAAVRPALRGEDVMALGVPPGPAVGQVLERLRDARLDGRVHGVDGEAAEVRMWLSEREA
jgi:tRNA nucleotidyltransferase (CCA-adding enzyme)